MLGDRPAFDVARPELGQLLASIVAACSASGQTCVLDVRGQSVSLTSENVGGQVRLLQPGPTFRVLVLDENRRLVENLCFRIWRHGGRSSWLALSPDAPFARFVATSGTPGVAPPARLDTSVTFPIDAVYTWVNADDPGWREMVSRFMEPDALDLDRFAQSDELRYSLRSLDLFAPWIRRIHVLTNCSPPDWFVPSDRVRWVDHREVIDDEYLPTFNSDVIETFLHRIPGLSEQFLYLNDDCLLWNSAFPIDAFTFDGRTISHLAPQGLVPYWAQQLDEGAATSWQASRVNGARLMLARYGFLPTRQHEHVPHSLQRSLLADLENEFAAELRAMRSSRFRAMTDIAFVAFLYHAWAGMKGRAIPDVANQVTLNAGGYEQLDLDRLARAEFLCVNDAESSAGDPSVRNYWSRLFERRLPIPSSAERRPG